MPASTLRSRSTARLAAVALLPLALAACGVEPAPQAEVAHSTAPTSTAPVHGPGTIVGTIDVDPALGLSAADLAAFDSIFILGKRPGQGMSGLVTKVPAGPFPVPFVLEARHLMGPGTMRGEWTLIARLDSDGDARALAGDVEGTLSTVSAGDPPVRLVLDSVLSDAGEPILLDGGGHGAPDQRLLDAEGNLPAGHPALPSGHPPMGSGMPAAGAGGDPHAGLEMGGDPHAGLGMGADPHAGLGLTAEGGELPGPRVKGTLLLGDAWAHLDGSGVLFLMVKGTSGTKMPRAVLRIPAPRFPLAFDIGPEDVTLDVENKADMLQGELVLSARLDSNGNALDKGPGDVESAPLTLQADGEAVEIVLDQAVSG